jgi:ubiquinone biosynthesis protein UbiJ
MNQGILLMIIAASLEENFIDILLAQEDLSGFTSSHVHAHGAGTKKLSLVEQVTGRQHKVQLMVYGEIAVLNRLVALLKAKFMHADTRYMLMPTLDLD